MHNFKELRVWQASMDLAVEVYNATKDFPSEERYGLTSQIRRSAVSIPSNIAEGACRNTKKEFNYFLGISGGSCGELETQVILAGRLGLLTETDSQKLTNDAQAVKKMTYKLKNSLKLN